MKSKILAGAIALALMLTPTVASYASENINDKEVYLVYFILNLCAKFSLKSQPSIYGKYGKWIL